MMSDIITQLFKNKPKPDKPVISLLDRVEALETTIKLLENSIRSVSNILTKIETELISGGKNNE
jgi:chaperonin cofactor prefoldin